MWLCIINYLLCVIHTLTFCCLQRLYIKASLRTQYVNKHVRYLLCFVQLGAQIACHDAFSDADEFAKSSDISVVNLVNMGKHWTADVYTLTCVMSLTIIGVTILTDLEADVNNTFTQCSEFYIGCAFYTHCFTLPTKGIFHYHRWTTSIKPRLLFSHAGYASWGLSFSSV